jgi:FixJ family two-component response regulator
MMESNGSIPQGLDKLPYTQEALQSQGLQTPIILITAYANEKHRSRALDAGALGFLSKPFNEESLIKCLTAAIKVRSS